MAVRLEDFFVRYPYEKNRATSLKEYTVRKIKGEQTEAEQAASAARASLVAALVDIIQSLHWKLEIIC